MNDDATRQGTAPRWVDLYLDLSGTVGMSIGLARYVTDEPGTIFIYDGVGRKREKKLSACGEC
jgi:hypothetical protein